MPENPDQNISEYGHVLRSAHNNVYNMSNSLFKSFQRFCKRLVVT